MIKVGYAISLCKGAVTVGRWIVAIVNTLLPVPNDLIESQISTFEDILTCEGQAEHSCSSVGTKICNRLRITGNGLCRTLALS